MAVTRRPGSHSACARQLSDELTGTLRNPQRALSGLTTNLDCVVFVLPAILIEPLERECDWGAFAIGDPDINKADAEGGRFRARICAIEPVIAAPMEHKGLRRLNPQRNTRRHRAQLPVGFPYLQSFSSARMEVSVSYFWD
jgi:hypothetical protein